jgi:hypothetical protein
MLKLGKETSFCHEPTRLDGLDSQDKATAIVSIGLMHTRSVAVSNGFRFYSGFLTCSFSRR